MTIKTFAEIAEEQLPIPRDLHETSSIPDVVWGMLVLHGPSGLDKWVQGLSVAGYRATEAAIEREISRTEDLKRRLITARNVMHQAVNGR